MSSLRNAVKRVTHKERAQPESRKKFGLLEKHKDYVERARDYHKKQDLLTTLKKKAEERNPDEFYFKMHNAVVTKGVHKEVKKGTSLDMATVKLLKSQDAGYIVHKKAVDDKVVEKLKKNLHLIGERNVKSHKIFVDEEEEVEKFDVAEHFQTVPALAEQAYNRVRLRSIEKAAADGTKVTSAVTVKKAMEKRDKAYKELEQRARRAGKLDKALKKLTQQRNVMGKGSKRKITTTKDGNAAVGDEIIYKWKRQRSR